MMVQAGSGLPGYAWSGRPEREARRGAVRAILQRTQGGRGRRIPPALRALSVAFFLYVFLVGVASLELGIKLLGSDFEQDILSRADNPIAAVCAGVLATVLVQSSSVTTSTIVGLVGSGALGVDAAVPLVMGANIGTTVTNTLASLGSAGRNEEFRRAFAGATMHDFFNLICVVVFLPLELTTGLLSGTAEGVADLLGGNVQGGSADSPVKRLVKEPAKQIEALLERVFDSEQLMGVILLAAGLLFIFVALVLLTRNMRRLISGRIEASMNRMVARGGGVVGIATGAVVTVGVQSSSITTSILVPMVGSGVLTLRNAFPITLGANLGTTVTALLASLAVDLRAGLAIALTHALFNLFGIVLIYPIRAVREVPIRAAEILAENAVRNRSVVAVYILGAFVGGPLLGLLVFS